MFLKTTKKILDENLKTGSTVIIISRNIPHPYVTSRVMKAPLMLSRLLMVRLSTPLLNSERASAHPITSIPKLRQFKTHTSKWKSFKAFHKYNGSFVCKNVRNRNWPPDFVAWLSTLRVFFKLILWIRIVISRVWCWQCTLKRVMVVQHAGLLCIAISNRCTSQLIFFLPVINLCCCCCYQQHIVKGVGDNTLVCLITLSFD